MLSQREQAVKKLLLSELPHNLWPEMESGFLTYAEKQSLRDDLNLRFIDEEIEEMQRQMKWTWIQAGTLLATIVAYGFLFDWSGAFVVGLAISIPVFALQVKAWKNRKKRMLIYRALRALAESSAVEAFKSPAPSPSAPDASIANSQ